MKKKNMNLISFKKCNMCTTSLYTSKKQLSNNWPQGKMLQVKVMLRVRVRVSFGVWVWGQFSPGSIVLESIWNCFKKLFYYDKVLNKKQALIQIKRSEKMQHLIVHGGASGQSLYLCFFMTLEKTNSSDVASEEEGSEIYWYWGKKCHNCIYLLDKISHSKYS